MKTTGATAVAIGVAVLCAAGLAAETQGGRNVTVLGCVERGSNGDYVLTQVRNDSRLDRPRYAIITSQDLSTHVGERGEIKGKAVTNGDGKVSIESKTQTEADHTKDQETKTKSESTSGAFDLPLLGVRSMRTVSSSCG
jgi:hypothetical protein